MKSIRVCLPSAQQVQAFVEVISTLDGSFDLIYGDYVLDARSLMGIFSLDLSQPLELRIGTPSEHTLAVLQPFLAPAGTAGAHPAPTHPTQERG